MSANHACYTLYTLALLVLNAPADPAQQPADGRSAERVVAYVNGLWFDGATFAPGTWYVVDDRLASAAPRAPDKTVELRGRWVVPPYADAHNHWLEAETLQLYNDYYLRRGVFYFKDQSTALFVRRAMDELLAGPESVDFISANQGFTASGGHPLEIVQQGMLVGLLPADLTPARIDGEVVLIVDTAADIEPRWKILLEGRPDFVKVFLQYSELYAERRDDPAFLFNRGLDPALVPGIVERAHAAGLEVSAHVYTAHDFRVAVAAGVDQIAHFPGNGYDPELGDVAFLLDDEDAWRASEGGVSVVTTLTWLADMASEDPAASRGIAERVIVPNLELLRAHDVPLLIGSDQFRRTSDEEFDFLATLGVWSPTELLANWCSTTPRAIFPERKIGRIAEGFEASFLVLRGNPLENLEHAHDIALWVKQGRELKPRDVEFPPLGR